MFPTRLNLLSDQKKTHLRHLLFFQFIKNILESFFIVMSLIGIMLLGSQWVLQNYFFDLTKEITQTNSKTIEKNSQIKQVNRVLSNLHKLQKEYTHWTPIIAEFANAIPPGITLQTLSMNAKSNNYVLSGTAQTREDLLMLSEILEEIDYISKVEIPLEQLTSKTNINFSIKAL